MTAVKLAPAKAFQNARSEFKEFSIGELKQFEKMFAEADQNSDGSLDMTELKYLMEKQGHPQTHLALKAMISEIDEDHDGVVSYREFLLVFRYAKTGQLKNDGLRALAASIDVGQAGVGGARGFFEKKAAATVDSVAERDREYREQAKAKQQEKTVSKAAFKEKLGAFQ